MQYRQFKAPGRGRCFTRARVALVLMAALAVGGGARAQSAPDAGQLLHELERETAKPLPPRQAPAFTPPPPMAPVGGASVTFKAFRFAGNTLLGGDQLAATTRGFLGRPLDFAQMQNVAIAVATAYRDAGWVVRAYLPQQDISEGVLTIQVVEARFGAVRLEGDFKRVDPARVARMAEAAQAPGAFVNGQSLDRAILLADDLPGVAITGRLSEGEAQAQTDLVLTGSDEPWFSGNAALDNAGSRSTGRGRALASLNINSPLRLGDQASATAMHSRGSDFLRLSYAFPLAANGLRLGLNAAHVKYKVLSPEFAALGVHGSSDVAGVQLDYPVLRARTRNLYASLEYGHKRFDNRSSQGVTTRYGVDAATLGLNGNLFDDLGGGGANAASLAWTQGRVDLSGSPNEAADAASTRTAGSFRKLTYSASREQVLGGGTSLYASLSGQRAGKNLDSSEKFVLGGPYGVRAYPIGEGSGSEGWLATLEARFILAPHWTLKGFYDRGSVRVNHHNDIAGAATPNRYSLQGVGTSLGWNSASGLRVAATLARRLGTNPNATARGLDQDGSLVRTRLWLQVGIPF